MIRLGAFRCEVFLNEETGDIDIQHETDLGEAFDKFPNAIHEIEADPECLALRSRACRVAAAFLVYLQDRVTEVQRAIA